MVLCFVQIGWKLVEKSFVEIAHDRKENPIFISVVEAFPLITRPCFLGTSTWVQLQSLKEKTFVSLGLIRLGTVAKKFAGYSCRVQGILPISVLLGVFS